MVHSHVAWLLSLLTSMPSQESTCAEGQRKWSRGDWPNYGIGTALLSVTHSSFIEHFLVSCARVVKGKSKQTKELKCSREEKPFKNNNMRKNLISSLTEVEVPVRSVPCLLLSFYLSHSHALFANFRLFPSNSSMSLWCLVLYLISGTFERLCTSRC